MKSAAHPLDFAAAGQGATPRRAALSILFALAVSMRFAAAGAAPTVITDTGSFIGIPSPSSAGVDVFFGIRYAAPPEGALRWTPPQPPAGPAGPVVGAIPGTPWPPTARAGPLAQAGGC